MTGSARQAKVVLLTCCVGSDSVERDVVLVAFARVISAIGLEWSSVAVIFQRVRILRIVFRFDRVGRHHLHVGRYRGEKADERQDNRHWKDTHRVDARLRMRIDSLIAVQ